MELSFESPDFIKLRQTLERVSVNIEKEQYTVMSAVGTKAKSEMSKEVNRILNVPQKEIKKTISIRKVRPIGVAVSLKKTNRLSLKRFKPRQVAGGVSVKEFNNRPTRIIPGAFMGPNPTVTSVKLRGHVFERKGKSRLPIRKVLSVSPYGVITKTPARMKRVRKKVQAEIRKQLIRRINFRRLKLAGTI